MPLRSPWIVALLVLAALGAPAALGDFATGGGPFFGLPDVPQEWCALVQTEAHSASSALRCDQNGIFAQGVVILRARVLGEGHVMAYADQLSGSSSFVYQKGPVDCRATATSGNVAPGVSACSVVFSPVGVSGTFNLHAFLDGPGHAVAYAGLETIALGLP